MDFESHKCEVQYNEADVGFSMSNAGKTSQQSDWFEFDESHQVMLPGPVGQTPKTCAKNSNVAKLEENRGVPVARIDGATLCMKFCVARSADEAAPDSETDFDVDATQLEESEETRRLKHNTFRRHVSKDKHGARHPGHGVERQWIMHTDPRQARTRVKTGEGRIISSRQTRQIHNT